MKRPALFIFITLLVTFGSFVMAQENQHTSSQPPMNQQNNGMMVQGQGGGMQNTKMRKTTDQGMMGQSTMMDCSGCIVNRVLMRSNNFFLDMSESLRLTGAQVNMLQQIRIEYVKETVDLQGELYVAQLELQDMLLSGDIQINDTEWKIGDTYDLEAELQKKKVKSMIEARNVLTLSQREQVKSMTLQDIMSPVTDNGREQRR